MEDYTTEKQNYLRRNILDMGYDADEFMQYLSYLKGEEGLDLSNWTMSELQSTVQEFISRKNSTQNHNNLNTNSNNNSNNILSKINSIVQSEINLDNDIYDNNYKLNTNNYNDNNINPNKALNDKYLKEETKKLESQNNEYIHCWQIEFTEISNTSGINIAITFPEKVAGGIFSKSYISYLMECSPFGFKVRKRFSDFEWLYNILNNLFVGCVVPPICKKNYGDRFTKSLIFKRARLFQKFMEGILVHPLMRNSQIIYDFISIDKEEIFEAKKKEYNKLKAPNRLADIKTLDGRMKVSVSKEKEIYTENIKDICKLNEEIIKKINSNYKQLIGLMQQVSEKLKISGELWKNLHDMSEKYYDTNNTCESYNMMSNMMTCLSDINNKSIELINKNIREYFRYIKNEYHSLKDLSIKVDEKREIYNKEYEKLYKSKENLFKGQDIKKWGLENPEDLNYKSVLLKNKSLAFSKMLPTETKKVRKVRESYGFYLNSFIDEYERIRLLNSRRHKDNILRFGKLIADIVIQFHRVLNEQIKYFDKLKDAEDTVPGTKKMEGYNIFS